MKTNDVITVENMRQSDAYTIKNFTESKTLMYNAAMGVYNSVEWKGNIAIVSGSGNNGGDGYALACILADNNISSTIITVSDKLSPDGEYYFNTAKEKQVEVVSVKEINSLDGFDIIVDCILGTGFCGEIRGTAKDAVNMINDADAYVVSVDINSGLNGDNGQAVTAVKSDLTVSIGYFKTGMFLCDAPIYIGSLVNADIGIKLLKKQYSLSAQPLSCENDCERLTFEQLCSKYSVDSKGENIIEKAKETAKNIKKELLVYTDKSAVRISPEYAVFWCDYVR